MFNSKLRTKLSLTLRDTVHKLTSGKKSKSSSPSSSASASLPTGSASVGSSTSSTSQSVAEDKSLETISSPIPEAPVARIEAFAPAVEAPVPAPAADAPALATDAPALAVEELQRLPIPDLSFFWDPVSVHRPTSSKRKPTDDGTSVTSSKRQKVVADKPLSRQEIFPDGFSFGEPEIFQPPDFPAVEERTFTTGQKRYLLRRIVGKGVHGCVRLCTLTEDEETSELAVKVVEKRILGLDGIPIVNEDYPTSKVSHMLEEIHCLRIAKESGCPFLPDFVDTFQDLDNIYVVMPRYAESLLTVLQRHIHADTPLNSMQLTLYASEMVLALQALHQEGIFHGDLKPANIMLTADGHICIVDFGTADSGGTSLLTGLRGTTGYMAPESLSGYGQPLAIYCGASADLYSFGVVLFEMLMAPLTIFTDYIEDRRIMYNKDMGAGRGFWCRDPDMQDLVSGILEPDPRIRMTMGRVKAHRAFRDVDWNDIQAKKFPVVYRPPTKGMLSVLPEGC
ncbi:kinase-like domain-containing protein [Mycena floridula]|nr:kinase-like domain-containing protein [Mycena floridula]